MIYLTILLILAAIMMGFLVYTIKKNAKCSQWIAHLLIAAICGTLFYSFFLLADNIITARFWCGMYFISTDWMALFMLIFVIGYSDITYMNKLINKIFVVLVLVDTLALLFNNYYVWMFDIVEKINKYRSDKTFFASIFYSKHYLHLALCYIMILWSIAILIYKIVTSSRMYKIKYVTILFFFMCVIICNAICYIQQIPIDISVSLYATLAVSICYFALEAIPKGLVSRAQSYMSEKVKQGLLCFDINGKLIYYNHAIDKAIDTSDEEFMKRLDTYFADKHKEFVEKSIETKAWKEKLYVKNDVKYFDNFYQILKDEKNKDVGYFFVVEDDTEMVKMYQEQKFKATHDLLTGLYNRESFFDKADEIISKNPEKPRYFIASDIKDFKLINTLYGKEYGDIILKLQADLVKQHMVGDTICGRIAGDKFAMLMDKDKFNKEEFINAVDKIKSNVDDNKFNIIYHIGIYDITGVNESAEKLYNRVNMAIAYIHNNYEQIFVKYDESIMDNIIREKQMVTEFDTAIEEKQFCMYLQPQIGKNSKLVGAEALARWNHPKKGLIFPDVFVPVFEKTSLIHKLDLEIWNQAAQKLADWKSRGINDIHISINISTKDFYYLNVYEELVNIVGKNDIDPRNLKLEITESAVMTDKNNDFRILQKLKEFGFDLELDDFGSGYSSLNMLKDFNVDVLKIDRMFLKETDNVEKSRIILNSVISLAKNLGMLVVTEGVEDITQVNNLKAMGCDIFQGYYFDKPISVEQFENKYFK